MKKKKRSPWQTLSDEGLDMHRKSTTKKKVFQHYHYRHNKNVHHLLRTLAVRKQQDRLHSATNDMQQQNSGVLACPEHGKAQECLLWLPLLPQLLMMTTIQGHRQG